ncbi:chromate efflux transporter [Phycicoccus avicenniae]|uniref:chromate efflux transporter n=1 Tax=Phycicoccus avicenniae TaxID=2828860 RepID=UPI003D2CE2B7
MPEAPRTADRPTDLVPFGQAVRAWFAISLQTFGGPAGQIAVMERELVERRRWIGHERFLHALSFCTLLPGPEAQQLAVYVGWLLNGVRGGLVAGTLFVLPGLMALLGLSAVYVAWGESAIVSGVFAAVAPAVLVVVAQAVLRVGRKALTTPVAVTIAVAAFLALTLLHTVFPLVVLLAGVVGLVAGRRRPPPLIAPSPSGDAVPVVRGDAVPIVGDDALHHVRPTREYAARVLGVGLLAWAVPMAGVVLLTGQGSVFTQQGLFFTGTALVTFGGAYAVLAFVAQRAVEVYGWLAPGEMTRGLALAESTPGPLIMVVQFVAFLGAFRDPGALSPWAAGILASLLTTWVVFVPSFVLVFLGAPFIERLRGNRSLAAALSGVTAAVVGVIVHLGVYLAVHTVADRTLVATLGPVSLELPDPRALDPVAFAYLTLAGALLLWRGWSVLRTLGACALVGLVVALARQLVT